MRFLFSSLLMLLGFASAQAAEHTQDTTATVKQRVQEKKALLLDVREQAEWDAGHLKAARLLPLSSLKEGDPTKATKDLPKDKILYLHCASGRRVLQAADILQKQGFDVRPLKAGFNDLLKEGFPEAEPKK